MFRLSYDRENLKFKFKKDTFSITNIYTCLSFLSECQISVPGDVQKLEDCIGYNGVSIISQTVQEHDNT